MHTLHIFARSAPTCMLNWHLLAKFLHWSSVGSLLRVCCWLGALTEVVMIPKKQAADKVDVAASYVSIESKGGASCS